MNIDNIFQNLTPQELEQAQHWYDQLHPLEQERIRETLYTLDSIAFCLDTSQSEKQDDIAVIVAGSSIDTKTYTDIDLFAIPRHPLSQETHARADPKSAMAMTLADHNLPEGVYYNDYGKKDCNLREIGRSSKESGLGAIITISLFYELTGFNARRSEHADDLLEPPESMGAEDIITYNREQGSKFLVLARQYSITPA
ncbi:MAG: hypothetical protein V1743_04350 [Nanoarchaeota archaeon]